LARGLTLAVFRQALDQRYTPAAVAYFQAAFTHTLKLTLQDQSPTPLAQLVQPHFAAVRLFDAADSSGFGERVAQPTHWRALA
jgi:hypothetical protein